VRCSGRIETRTLDDARQSATLGVRNAESQLAVARREVERTEQLVKAGAIAARDLDLAQANVTAVEAQLADAKPAGQRPAPARRRGHSRADRRPHLEEGRQPRRRGQPRHRALHRDRPVVDAARSRRALGRPVAAEAGRHRRVHGSGIRSDVPGRIERVAPQADPTTRRYRFS
jgi:hypothetical protein